TILQIIEASSASQIAKVCARDARLHPLGLTASLQLGPGGEGSFSPMPSVDNFCIRRTSSSLTAKRPPSGPRQRAGGVLHRNFALATQILLSAASAQSAFLLCGRSSCRTGIGMARRQRQARISQRKGEEDQMDDTVGDALRR